MHIYNTHDMPVQCTHVYMSVYDYNTYTQQFNTSCQCINTNQNTNRGLSLTFLATYVSAASQYQYLQLPSRSLFPSTSHYLASQYQYLQLPVPIRQHCRLSICSHFGWVELSLIQKQIQISTEQACLVSSTNTNQYWLSTSTNNYHLILLCPLLEVSIYL